MLNRTNTRTVHFRQPFTLKGVEGEQPAGDYQVRDEEEPIDGLSWLAYRRVATVIEVSTGPNQFQFITVDNDELHAAIEKDEAAYMPPV